MKKTIITTGVLVILLFLVAVAATTIDDFFLPGSQVGQSGNIETPDRCDNCHGGYDLAVEPAFNWRGSMMSQAARDPLFYACLAIANQDAPDVGDMCLRCHTPDGWLNGRCVPTDGSALNNNDRQGVQCDFCHKMVKPTPLGVNPYPSDGIYTSQTYPQDQSYLAAIIPIPGTTANGMYIADANNAKRGPFSDAVGRHQMFYSPFHSTSDHCGTCHDVSNPQFTRTDLTNPVYVYNAEGTPAPDFNLRYMLPVERTYSEWLASGYSKTTVPTTCQDCHMQDVTGKGAKMKDAPVRTNLPLHDMTGGNTFVPNLVKIQSASEINPAALDAGIIRARNTLQKAATLELTVSGNSGNYTSASVKVINNTGHKLPTGYPEGRRIWINLRAYDASNAMIGEFGAYNDAEATLTTGNTKVYETHPGISPAWSQTLAGLGINIPAGESFHFVLNDMVYKDNRIPPAGFTNAELNTYQSPVVDYTYPDGQNYDITNYTLPANTAKVEAKLYYQTTTREYVEFLRNSNVTNTKGQELYDLWAANGKSAPELMATAIEPKPALSAAILSVTRTTNNKGFSYATALVEVTCDGDPIQGAAVISSFVGPTNGTVAGQTGADGRVFLNTTSKKNATGTWCFTLTSVTKTGYNSPGSYPTLCENSNKSTINEDAEINYANDLAFAPNPAASTTSLTYSVAETSQVVINIYDQSGKLISAIAGSIHDPGIYLVDLDVSSIQRGIYYVVMKTKDTQISKKLVIVR